MESFQETRKQEPGPGGADSQPDFPDFSGFDFLDPMLQVLFQVLDLLQGTDQGLSRFCELKMPSSEKQLGMQLFFQFADMFAETLLGGTASFFVLYHRR